MATYLEAQNDKSLRTKENAPFGGWGHYEMRIAKEVEEKAKYDQRFYFIQNVAIMSQAEVLNLLVRKLEEHRELYTMMGIMVMEISNRVSEKGMALITTEQFFERAYPEVMSIIKRIDSMEKPWGELKSTFNKKELLKMM